MTVKKQTHPPDGDSHICKDQLKTQQIELDLLLDGIFRKYGYDFRDYGRAHVKRRVDMRVSNSNLTSISHLQYKILHDEVFFQKFLRDMSVNVTEMFRDPNVYAFIRKELIPLLKTYPYLKIWHAGCSSGEEVYSLAILLLEEGLHKKTQIYATDFNDSILETAREGIYNIERIKEFTQNYNLSGGKESFSDYYHAEYEKFILSKQVRSNIVFSNHNLVADGVFGEMNLIFCRNVLIYFNRNLQDKVLELFYESLIPGGYLCLGKKESIFLTEHADKYTDFDQDMRIYKRKY